MTDVVPLEHIARFTGAWRTLRVAFGMKQRRHRHACHDAEGGSYEPLWRED